MKILNLIVLVISMNLTYSQTELRRIEQSNFFTNQENVFYVYSNKFNSSGIIGEILKGMDTLQISNQEDKIFDNGVKIISKQQFVSTYEVGKQYFEHLTIAIKIKKIDSKNFKLIDKNYIQSNNLLFYKIDQMKDVNISNFEIIADNFHQALSKDNNYVFYKSQIIEGANPKTFKILKEEFTKDNKHVYRREAKIEKADPASFEVLTYTYQKDRNYVWSIGVITDIDVQTFKVLKYSYPNFPNKEHLSLYAIDKKNVYFQGKIIPEADVKSFKLITSASQTYGIDENNVFYNDERIDVADVKTFTVIKSKTQKMNYDAQDKNYFFIRNNKIKKTIANNSYK